MTYAVGSLVTSFVAALATAIAMSRIYGVTTIGEFAVAAAPCLVLVAISTVNEQVAMVRSLAVLDPDHASVPGVFGMILAFSFLLTGALGAFIATIATLLLNGPLHHRELVAPAIVLVVGYVGLDNTSWNIEMALSAFRRARELYWGRLAQAAAFLVAGICLSVLTHSVWGLTFATVVAAGVGLAVRSLLATRVVRLRPSWASMREALPQLPGMIRFGAALLPGSLAGAASSQIGIWVLSAIGSFGTVGAYSRALGLARRFGDIGHRASEILYPALVRQYAAGAIDDMAATFRTTARRTACFVLMVVACGGVLGRRILELFGPGFDAAAGALVLLLCAYSLYAINCEQNQVFNAVGRPRRSSATSLIGAATTLASMYPLTNRWSGTGIAAAVLLGYAVESCANHILLRPLVPRGSRSETLSTLAGLVVSGAVGAGTALLVASTSDENVVTVLALAAGCALYGLATVATGLVTLEEYRGVVNRLWKHGDSRP